VRGQGAEDLKYTGGAEPLQQVWIALRANIREVLEETTLANVVSGELPAKVVELTEPAEAWAPR
jgi:DNA-binding IscR family transcriptional regulator